MGGKRVVVGRRKQLQRLGDCCLRLCADMRNMACFLWTTADREQMPISVCPGGAGGVHRVPVVGRDDEGGRVQKSWSNVTGREAMGQKRSRVDGLPRGRERPRGGVYYISDSATDRMINSE